MGRVGRRHESREADVLISSKGRYALRLMIFIAAFGDDEGKIALREVAERESISLKYLEQLVRPLMAAGLLRSVRGKGGGYMLARPAADISAGEILRAAEGSTAAVACDGLEGSCGRADLCSTVKFWTTWPMCPSSTSISMCPPSVAPGTRARAPEGLRLIKFQILPGVDLVVPFRPPGRYVRKRISGSIP